MKIINRTVNTDWAKPAVIVLFAGMLLCLAASPAVLGQPSSAKIYRGSVGETHIQMRLNFNGRSVTGAYTYDSVGEEIKLTGNLDEQGKLELSEFGAKGK